MTLNEKILEIVRLEQHVLDEIAELPNYGGECHSSHHAESYTRLNQETREPEIETYCLKCGGRIT